MDEPKDELELDRLRLQQEREFKEREFALREQEKSRSCGRRRRALVHRCPRCRASSQDKADRLFHRIWKELKGTPADFGLPSFYLDAIVASAEAMQVSSSEEISPVKASPARGTRYAAFEASNLSFDAPRSDDDSR